MRKKVFLICLSTVMLGSTAYANTQPKTYKGYPVVDVNVNGSVLLPEVPAINIEGSTMVPLRAVSESLGAEVMWDDAHSTVLINSKNEQNEERKVIVGQLKRLLIISNEAKDLERNISLAKEYKDIRKNEQMLKTIINKQTIDLKSNVSNYLLSTSSESLSKKMPNPTWELINQLSEAIQLYEVSVQRLLSYYSNSQDADLVQYIELLSLAYQKSSDMNLKLQQLIVEIEFK
ncbi:stalk domain-containing protein [Gorillibacterium sp. sgz5001074]|uniref:stalk domain-containing protein n=1 Tax=Gorillibacterium sp. sgz5001074 TaxID=3446695 RepID=UPI003F67A0B7